MPPVEPALAERQRSFGAALLDNRLPVPPGLVGPDGLPSARRFAVYRNNVMVGLIDALADGFPTLQRLVGREFFRAMAGVYARAEPPGSPILLNYGAGFAEFVAAFPPLRHLPYLADVARIERAWVEAYHAAEATPAGVTPLLAMTPAELGAQALGLHPSLRLVRSEHAAFSIWQANQPGQDPGGLDPTPAEDALILRAAAEVTIRRLAPGEAAFVQALCRGASLAQAAGAGFGQSAGFGFAPALSALLLSGAVTGWRRLSRNPMEMSA